MTAPRGANWPVVLDAIMTDLAADTYFASVFGVHIRLASNNAEHRVPVLEAMMIADGVSELWEPFTLQFDTFHADFQVLTEVESALRKRYHQDLPIEIGGLQCWAQYSDGSMLETPGRDGYFGRGLRFRFTPLRAAYTRGT